MTAKQERNIGFYMKVNAVLFAVILSLAGFIWHGLESRLHAVETLPERVVKTEEAQKFIRASLERIERAIEELKEEK